MRSVKTGKFDLLSSVGFGVLLAVAGQPMSASAQTASEGGSVEGVVVSATRVAREGYTAPTPLTSITRDTLDDQAATVLSDVIYQIPSVRPAPNATGTSQASGNYVNLRGFGATRTLTLVDGKRFVPSNGAENSGGSSVDLNLIPEALVERIEVVTGGASAAWGSDAVGGVVNLILKRRLDGIQGSVQYGVSGQGDAKSFSADLAAGTSFADGRGQIMVALEHSQSYDMPTAGDRDYINQRCAMVPGTVGGVAYSAVKTCGLTLNGYTNGGVLVQSNGNPLASNNPLYGRQFLSSTASSPFNYGDVKTTSLSIGGDGGWKGTSSTPVAPLLRNSLYARTLFDLTSNVTLSLDGSYGESGTKLNLFINSIPSATDSPIQILTGNPYIPANVQSVMTANSITAIYMSRITPELGYAKTNSNNRVARFSAGLEGKLGESWSWDAYGAWGYDWYDTNYSNNMIVSNVAAALDVIINPATGKPDCRMNVQGAAVYAPGTPAYGAMAGCVPANPFGPGSLTSAANYMAGTLLTQESEYEQWAAGASLRGEPFNTWAGPVSVATGVDYRREWVIQRVSPYSDFVNPPAFASGGYQQSNPKSFSGQYEIKEVFGEAVVPLLSEQALAKSLDLNGAVRFTDYSTSGQVTTWKVGVTYEPTDGILFRSAHSKDIRAASLFENFGANTTYGTVNTRGPGGVQTGQVQAVSPGLNNPNLKPEEAKTTTVGVTFRNVLIDRLYVAIDGYRIELTDQIGKLGAQGIIDTCYGGGTAAGKAPDPTSCALISNNQTVVVNPFLNLGTTFSEGVEFDVGYTLPAETIFGGAAGDFTARLLANYIATQKVNTSGLVEVETVGDQQGDPQWRWNASLGYRNDAFGATLTGRYVGEMTRYNLAPANTFVDPVVPAYFYMDASARYKILRGQAKNAEIYFNVRNLLDEEPPFVPGTGANGSRNSPTGRNVPGYTRIQYYDVIGRAFTFGARFDF